MEEAGFKVEFDAVIGRGGLLKPTQGGVYLIDERIKYDLINAIKKTFERRESKFDINIITSNFNLIKNSEKLKINFKRYKNKKVYVKDISYEDVMNAIEKIIKLLQSELTSIS